MIFNYKLEKVQKNKIKQINYKNRINNKQKIFKKKLKINKKNKMNISSKFKNQKRNFRLLKKITSNKLKIWKQI